MTHPRIDALRRGQVEEEVDESVNEQYEAAVEVIEDAIDAAEGNLAMMYENYEALTGRPYEGRAEFDGEGDENENDDFGGAGVVDDEPGPVENVTPIRSRRGGAQERGTMAASAGGDDDEDTAAKVAAIRRAQRRAGGNGSGNTADPGTLGPKSGEGPNGERAVSGKRDGNVDEDGTPLTKEGRPDGRTVEGRAAVEEDKDYTPEELAGFLDTAAKNADGTYDLRTVEGRALLAYGLVDDDGNEVDGLGGADDEPEAETQSRSGAQGRGSAARPVQRGSSASTGSKTGTGAAAVQRGRQAAQARTSRATGGTGGKGRGK